MIRSVLIAVIFFIVVALSGCGGNSSPPAEAGSGLTINSMTWSQNLFEDEEQILTLAKYERIKVGTSYQELTVALGLPPDRWRPPDIDSVTPECPVELKWFAGRDQNKDRSITVKLRGKTVIEKSQNGLP